MQQDPIIKAALALEAALQNKDFSKTVPLTGCEETDRLINSVNVLLEQLQDAHSQNSSLKDSIRSQVSVHTFDLEKKVSRLEASLNEVAVISKSKSVFLSNLSHELRTPLNHIIGFSELMSEEARMEGKEQWVFDLKQIHESGHHMLNWVNEIIDLSTIESGRGELKIDEIPVELLITEVTVSIEQILEEAEIQIDVVREGDLGSIRADHGRLCRILKNLFSNACKASGKGKIGFNIKRETVKDTDWISFSIQDCGAGIDSRILEELFKQYTESQSNIAAAYGAEALNLAICNRLTLAMGGSISAETEFGSGSKFTLRLPADIQTHLAKPHVRRATSRLMGDILDRSSD
ncbi:MAG: HAMP domain-containing histidine kinase [Candidatus Nitrohelix vancouverensis]|uniref:histidine kinase n=1 Tax=Candidatus Nitrohelix vancouverensis TaxID=2705534 RepID=A0A7T0C385_9BACT|nr:MAG: HAMP domain-containing histidine kinase [Candidatus Nitrohelix vancouverensis]